MLWARQDVLHIFTPFRKQIGIAKNALNIPQDLWQWQNSEEIYDKITL